MFVVVRNDDKERDMDEQEQDMEHDAEQRLSPVVIAVMILSAASHLLICLLGCLFSGEGRNTRVFRVGRSATPRVIHEGCKQKVS